MIKRTMMAAAIAFAAFPLATVAVRAADDPQTAQASPGDQTSAQSGPVQAADGSLRYVYGGRSEPTLTCRPLFVCDVTLEAGETVLNLAIGDSLRWVVASAQSGPGGNVPHVFVKPTETRLETNLVITTTKRVYYLRLQSSEVAPEPRLSFSYPEEEGEIAAAKLAAEKALQADAATEIPLLPPDQLDYNYRIVGAHEIAPQRVYNDGVHSFIEYTALPTDLPVVYAVAPDGSDQIVNYRLRGTIFIVDGIQSGFDLVLNAGTGRHGHGERRIFIRHK